MTVLEFIASLAESLAWPTATLIAVFWLRKPITNALEKRLRRAKLGSAEFEFDPEKTEELRAEVEGERAELERSSPLPSEAERQPVPRPDKEPDRATKLAELAELSPVGAFLTSFIELERTLRELLADRDEALVGGHEILPIGGHEPPRWRSRNFPNHGQQISPAPVR